MKKFVALLLALFLTFAAPGTIFAEESKYTYFSDPFLDIPWSITSEEFIEYAQNNLNLTFVPTEAEPLCLQLEQPEAWRFWDEPVESVMAYCMPMDFFSTRTYAVSLPDTRFERVDSYICITVDFAPRPEETSLENRLTQFSDLFAQCQTQFGDPEWPRMFGEFLPDEFDSSIPFYEQTDEDIYSIPMVDNIFQKDIALEMLNRPYDFVVISANFRNHAIALRYTPSNLQVPIVVRFTVIYRSRLLNKDLYSNVFSPFPSSK